VEQRYHCSSTVPRFTAPSDQFLFSMNTDPEKSPVMDSKDKKQPSEDTVSVRRGAIAAVTSAVDLEDLKISGLDPTYELKADLVNHAVQAIGMGKYQWWLFVVTGFGWLVDQASLNRMGFCQWLLIENMLWRA
jgi:hypothetical protein